MKEQIEKVLADVFTRHSDRRLDLFKVQVESADANGASLTGRRENGATRKRHNAKTAQRHNGATRTARSKRTAVGKERAGDRLPLQFAP